MSFMVARETITAALWSALLGRCAPCACARFPDGRRACGRRVFDRFWQAGRHDRRGLGLGLYISRCIVEGNGGRIWAESTLGAGTTISFTLPQAERKRGVQTT